MIYKTKKMKDTFIYLVNKMDLTVIITLSVLGALGIVLLICETRREWQERPVFIPIME